jgi:hypothetical protein
MAGLLRSRSAERRGVGVWVCLEEDEDVEDDMVQCMSWTVVIREPLLYIILFLFLFSGVSDWHGRVGGADG